MLGGFESHSDRFYFSQRAEKIKKGRHGENLVRIGLKWKPPTVSSVVLLPFALAGMIVGIAVVQAYSCCLVVSFDEILEMSISTMSY